jgi:lipopolysaccharide biosynthesis glycosyltransferase
MPEAQRVLFVTAAGESYVPLLRGLVESLQQWHPLPYTSLACFDLGLNAATRQWLAQYAAHISEPDWDLPVSEALRARQPHLRALTVRPFLPKYFPGYDIYLWIDADCWVQQRQALDGYLAEAARGRLAVAAEVHHTYNRHASLFMWQAKRLHRYFGMEAAQRLSWSTFFNAGVFAMHLNAPHWTHWANAFANGLKATDGELCCDQTALNHLIWTSKLPVSPMPATYNWLCHLSLPAYDLAQKRFCEPAIPRSPLGILHLAADSRNKRITTPHADGVHETGLHFPGLS